MNLSKKLDIVLITYNRKNFLEETFKQIFAENSPIKDFDITILNNASTDGTKELVEEYCLKYPNLKYINNKKNIGGCANIAKALVEIPEKEYIWVLCDNDSYDWSVWQEIENAIDKGYDAIFTRNCKNNAGELFYTATLVSGCIYKTNLITNTVAENIYDSIKNLFPHLAVISYVINNDKRVYVPTKDIVYAGINPGHDSSFTRGLDLDNLSEGRKNIFWSVGYFSTIELIRDKKVRSKIIDSARHFHKSLFDLFKTVMIKNKLHYKNNKQNFIQIFRMLNFNQKLKFIAAFLLINFSFKNYKFYEIRSKEQWKEYFKLIDEQDYINKIAPKLRGKKVLLYGAGIIAESILEDYNLSDINIIGIADKRFERTQEETFMGFKTIKPEDINSLNFDCILCNLKLYTSIKKSLQKNGINKKIYSGIKTSFKYPIRK